jgi:hypothetical protein
MAKKPSDPVKLNLRFTEALRLRLEKQATKNQRSLNEEIIRRLEDSFQREDLEEFAERVAEKLGSTVTVKIGDEIVKQFQRRGGDGK